jgi:hypothetical protein
MVGFLRFLIVMAEFFIIGWGFLCWRFLLFFVVVFGEEEIEIEYINFNGFVVCFLEEAVLEIGLLFREGGVGGVDEIE